MRCVDNGLPARCGVKLSHGWDRPERFRPVSAVTSMAVVIRSLLDGGERHERLRALAPGATGEHPLGEEIDSARDHRDDAGILPVHSTPQEKPKTRPAWNTIRAAV